MKLKQWIKYYDWTSWFAWYPIKTTDKETIWLETVERRMNLDNKLPHLWTLEWKEYRRIRWDNPQKKTKKRNNSRIDNKVKDGIKLLHNNNHPISIRSIAKLVGKENSIRTVQLAITRLADCGLVEKNEKWEISKINF